MMASFDEIETAINTVPITYLPALLITIVKRCVRDKVFVDGGMQKVVAKASLAASSERAAENAGAGESGGLLNLG